MKWADFYLICFVVGLTLSVLSFAFGALHLHLPMKWHLARAGGHSQAGAHGGAHGSHASRAIAWWSPPAVFLFLAWFGGTGFLLSEYYRIWFVLALALATTAGCLGEGILWWFLVKTLMPYEAVLQDSDFELVGTIAKVNSTIREGGTGEIVFSQGGVRKCAGARREDGKALEKGREVVIARVEKGIAYVSPWEDWSK